MMRTECVMVDVARDHGSIVRYEMSVTVPDDATNADVLEAAEQKYMAGDLGVLGWHEIDPDNDFRGKDGEQ